MKKQKTPGRPREYDYKGQKKVTSIRLTEEEKKKIIRKWGSIQAFVQEMIEHYIIPK